MDGTGLGTSRTGRMIGALFALILVVSPHPRTSAAVTPILGGGIAGGGRGGAQGATGSRRSATRPPRGTTARAERLPCSTRASTTPDRNSAPAPSQAGAARSSLLW